MRLSRYFLPILKETPQEAQIISHRLMLRAGMIKQLSAGIYNWLPLGLTVMKNIEQIIREEMNNANCVEILMSTLQPAELWKESGRYDDYGKEMLRIEDRHERPLLYGPTNEEVVTEIFRSHVKSYKDLPMNLYQIQWKFRDEIRPRFGVMRGREFFMKDAYSFDIDFENSKETYNNMYQAYLKTFKRLGLTAIPVRADSGAIGGNLSHEFQILAKTGESEIHYDKAFEELMDEPKVDLEKLQSLYTAADDMHDPKKCPVKEKDLKSARGIEVGHIFYFGDKYSKAMNCKVMNNEGKEVYPEMGSYGIGVSRLVGGIIEAYHDDNGIIWPESVAPFQVGLINIKTGDNSCDKTCTDIYNKLNDNNISTLYDDTKNSAGSKFATMDLIGLPWQIAIGPRSIKVGTVELKNRKSGEKQELSLESALKHLTKN